MTETSRTRPVRNAAEKGRKTAQEGPATMLPDVLKGELGSALQSVTVALAERALSSVTDKMQDVTGRLTDFAEGNEPSLLRAITGSDLSPGSILGGAKAGAVKGALKGAVTGLFKGGKSKGTKPLKVTNIVETLDIGAPLRVVYNQWTQFEDFPSFMKKVENVDQESDEKINWKAQIFLSHRTWKSTILEQVPDDRIIWRSEGAKGHVNGAVSFHELAPNITRVTLVLEYHPQGLFEHTGNLWRAQGRRARLEFKHFRRHIMTQVMLHPEEMAEAGWRGVIHDGEVVKDHETAAAEEREREEGPQEEREEPRDEYEVEVEPKEEEGEEGEGERAELDEEEEAEEEPEEEEAEEEPEEEEEERPRRARAGAASARERSRSQNPGRPVRRRRAEDAEDEEEASPRPARRRTGARGSR
ncbi:SRPBCC family protein [Nonomuraea lactucae]|uniref:SRPBCC family protein n=1 Tax=Nonomuraea lactucae TaxID=2249762 RepID=UPI000DE2892E|nr:SRPBCC family protein [Nonomuraea lactucae]